MVDRGIALSFLDLGAIRGWMVSTTTRPLYPRERPGTHTRVKTPVNFYHSSIIHPSILSTDCLPTHLPTNPSIHPSICAFSTRSARKQTRIRYGCPIYRLKSLSGRHHVGDLSVDGKVILHVRICNYMCVWRKAYGAFALLCSKNCPGYCGKGRLVQKIFCLT
jgi:hypothetical protein